MTSEKRLDGFLVNLVGNRGVSLALIISATLVLIAISGELSADNSGLSTLLNDAQKEINTNLLKPASKLGAMGGAVMAMFRAFTASGYAPVVMWGGTAVFASLLPNIIDKLFGI